MSEYECCHVDFDTVLHRAADYVQESYIEVTNKATQEVMEFSGVQKFYGTSNKKKDGGWIGEWNANNELQVKYEDFIVEQKSRLKPLPEETVLMVDGKVVSHEELAELQYPPIAHEEVVKTEESHLDWAMGLIDFRIGAIKKTSNATDYRLWIGGDGNFRYDVAQILPYKGARKDKPILFQELKAEFLKKYKNKVCISRPGHESDDECSIKGWESYSHFRKTGKHKYVLSYIDKDLKMIPCPYFNYDKPELGITTPTIEECCHHFCIQLLKGDLSTDNIPGLKGIGDKTALKLLEDRNTPKEMYEAVVVAYKDFYGLEAFPFTSHRGVESTRTWLDMLRENARLLYMLREPNEVYDIEETLKRLGVDYE